MATTITPVHRVHPWKRGDLLSAKNLGAGHEGLNEVLRMWPWVLDSLRRHEQIFDENASELKRQLFPAIVTAFTAHSSNRWKYTIAEVWKTARAYGGWSTVTDGRSGTAYSMSEDMNSGSGIEGNGVDHSGADFTSTNFDMVPIPVNSKVAVMEIVFQPTDEPPLPTDPPLPPEIEYWIVNWPNADDGTC